MRNNKPKFEKLVEFNPSLSQYYNPTTNKFEFFKDNNGLIDLTQTILDAEFQLKVKISNDRLCPRVYNRVDYVDFVINLITCYSSEINERQEKNDENKVFKFVGLDIGTGHVAIYPLLASSTIKTRENSSNIDLQLIGTDIDNKSAKLATDNVALNKLEDSIEIQAVSETDEFFTPLMKKLKEASEAGRAVTGFTMCNPPFYSSFEEIKQKESFKKETPLSGRVIATQNELITSGGEAFFVTEMINQSLSLFENDPNLKIKWFTSLLGKYESAITVIQKLKDLKVSNYGITQFNSSETTKGTRRLIVFWSFDNTWRPTSSILNVDMGNPLLSLVEKPYLLAGITLHADQVIDHVKELPWQWVSFKEDANLKKKVLRVGFSCNVWGRAYRRSMLHPGKKRVKLDDEIWVDVEVIDDYRETKKIMVCWRGGANYSTFESFHGWLKKYVQNSINNKSTEYST